MMNVLVTYLSSSGNTKQLAWAIHEEIEGSRAVPLNEVGALDPYDLIVLGFPVIGQGAPRKVRRFLAGPARGKKVAIFITHGMPGDMELLAPMLDRCREAARGSQLVGMMDCQGRMVDWMAKLLRLHPNPEVRMWVRAGGERIGVGHPSEADLEMARAFARVLLSQDQPHVAPGAIRG